MSIAVCYILPLDNLAATFSTHAREWVSTYTLFRPTIDHDVIIIYSNGTRTAEHEAVFSQIKYTPLEFNGGGWDIGAFQGAALSLDHDFVVFMNARTYFWKPGWLDRL